jgi:hypothetical protein
VPFAWPGLLTPFHAKYALPSESIAPPLGSETPRSEFVVPTRLCVDHVRPPSCETEAKIFCWV